MILTWGDAVLVPVTCEVFGYVMSFNGGLRILAGSALKLMAES